MTSGNPISTIPAPTERGPPSVGGAAFRLRGASARQAVPTKAPTDSRIWDLEQLHTLCRLRSTLECFAVLEQRRKHKGNEWIRNLGPHLENLRQAAVRSDYDEFHKADRLLHRHVIESCALPTLTQSWELVVAELDGWIHHVQEVYWPSLMALYREHEFLFEAWQSPEDWIAEESTHQHLEAGWYRLAATRGDPRPEIDPVARATSFISTHYGSSMEVSWIARNVSFVSTSHLNRLFREKLGVSPNAFIRRTRMEKAAELLASTPDKVGVIARRVGYRNVSHFGRDFLGFHGITPLKFRRERMKL